MSYTTPATFVDDTALSAAQLNTLSQAVTELQSIGEMPGSPFLMAVATSSAGTTFSAHVRHAHRYLWWQVVFGDTGQGDDMTLTIYPESGGSHELFADSSPTDMAYTQVEDLNGLLDPGEFYEIRLYIKVNSGGVGTWRYCHERSVAS